MSSWVGLLDGKLYLFDPKEKSEFDSIIILFDFSTGEYRKLNRLYTNNHIEKLVDQKMICICENKYKQWKNTGFFRPLNYKDLANQLQENRSPHERVTHCYNCKKGLTSKSGITCAKCGWIVCSYCGACGCGYSND